MGLKQKLLKAKNKKLRANKKKEQRQTLEVLRRMVQANQNISRLDLARRIYGNCFSDIDEQCGYPEEIEFNDYKRMYEREGVASRVVSIFPSECWSVCPEVYEHEKVATKKHSPFEKRWDKLNKEYNVLGKLARADEASGIGSYGILLIGTDDGLPLDQPAYSLDERNRPIYVKGNPRKLLYLMPFDEGEATIAEVDDDPTHVTFGKPLLYNVNIATPTGKNSVSYKETKVHWTRVVHIPSDGCLTNDIYGPPRMQKVWNYLLNLRKVYGGSGEMFWNGGFPGISFEVPPELAGQVELDKESLTKEIDEYVNGFKRYLALQNITANQLKSSIATPVPHILIMLEAICISIEVPLRVFKGTEEARLASMQDGENWNKKVQKRNKTHTTPDILRPFVDKLILMRVLPKPEQVLIHWPDLTTTSDKDQSDITGKLVKALAEYIEKGAFKLIPPLEFLTMFMNLSPEQAETVIKASKKAAKSKEFKYLEPPEPKTTLGGAGAKKPDSRNRGTNRPKPLGSRPKVKLASAR